MPVTSRTKREKNGRRAGKVRAAPAKPSFAKAIKPYIGMVKKAPSDLSMREGFGR